MNKATAVKFFTAFIIAALLILSGALAGCDKDNGNKNLEAGKGRVSGYVTDNEELLSPGTNPQKYEGAKIQIFQAIASGTYKTSGDSPEETSYTSGQMVIELESGADGYWQADLAPGKYYVKAFYGTQSYTGDIFFEIESSKTVNVDLELIHGV
jgi:hypothetical protein